MHGSSAKDLLSCKPWAAFQWGFCNVANNILDSTNAVSYWRKYLTSLLSLCILVLFFFLISLLLEIKIQYLIVWWCHHNKSPPHASEVLFNASRDLSYNQLTRLRESAFVGLGLLEKLNLGDNRISHIADGVFRGLTNLRTLWVQSISDNLILNFLEVKVLSFALSKPEVGVLLSCLQVQQGRSSFGVLRWQNLSIANTNQPF